MIRAQHSVELWQDQLFKLQTKADELEDKAIRLSDTHKHLEARVLMYQVSNLRKQCGVLENKIEETSRAMCLAEYRRRQNWELS